MKLYLALALYLLTFNAHASVRVFNSSGTNLGNYTDEKFANGLAVSQVSGKAQVSLTSGDGTTALDGFLRGQTAVSGDLAVSQCGKTITSDAAIADGPDLYNLPLIAPASLGCRMTFVVGTSVGLIVNPQTANKILLLTNAFGDAISADAVGESVVLESINSGWAPINAVQGTWTDIN